MRRPLVSIVALAALALATGPALAEENAAAAPRIRVEPPSFDFGKALPGKTLRKEFTLRNFGDADLVIAGVTTTCGCTAALTAENRLKPGAATVLRVTLETRSYTGKLERHVLVRSNDPTTPLLQVQVSASVEPAGGKPR